MELIREHRLDEHHNRHDNSELPVIRVAAGSRTASVAGAVAGIIRERNFAEVRAIGVSAVNQSVKAITLARDFLTEDGIEICFFPEFENVEIVGYQRTSIKFKVSGKRFELRGKN